MTHIAKLFFNTNCQKDGSRVADARQRESMVKNAGGDKVAKELTDTVIGRTGEAIQKAVTDEDNLKKY